MEVNIKKMDAEHKQYLSGLTNGGVLGFIAGCVFGVGLITPALRICVVDTDSEKEIAQNFTEEKKHEGTYNFPKNAP